MSLRIRVYGRHENQSKIIRNARALGIRSLTGCCTARLYFLSYHPGTEHVQRLCAFLLADPVVEYAEWDPVSEPDGAAGALGAPQRVEGDGADQNNLIEVTFRPGVTDIPARVLQRAMADLGMAQCQVATGTRYELEGNLSHQELNWLARKLFCNETIERYALGPIEPQFDDTVGERMRQPHSAEVIPILACDIDQLVTLSQQRMLALDQNEMLAIQRFYHQEEREPTDVELETLAQTWSEHCVHKTFRATVSLEIQGADGSCTIEEIDGLFQQYIRAATLKVMTDPAKAEWVRSVFEDDAGIVGFDDQFDLAFKVETHNHPSALEPFGGANTGIGGVVRDIMGVSARPIATTDILCFGPQNTDLAHMPDGILHPQRIKDGVVAGIADYGNKLGLPTVNGAVIYDRGYLGNPLVFCGCAGLLPKESHPTEPQIDDLVVVIGGRTGRDGLRGATFSSAELSLEVTEMAGSAVQIGDPITEKGVLELIEAARDACLYNAITDCGAGGFSSAVGEMGSQLGVDVELTHAPLKYQGLAPWEIWLSEAQERMVLAVPAANLQQLRALAELWSVELCVLGRFTGDGTLIVRYDDDIVAQLPMAFLHDGLPQRQMRAVWTEPARSTEPVPLVDDVEQTLLSLLSHPSVASKEEILRQYDHEVRGGTLVRPLVGPEMDGPADAALLKPLGTWHHKKAFTLSVGINPLLGKLDPYAMAISAIDEAFRNAVAVGADPDRIAILDNFCWGNPTYPDRLGGLARACQGCYDGAIAYEAPFISGKDSLFNEFEGEPIPGTLLISALGLVPDYNSRTTSDLKEGGNLLFLVGETRSELGGSILYSVLDNSAGTAPKMPDKPLDRYRQLHRAMGSGLVRSCHDCSEGGLAIALAEMALAGRLGVAIDLDQPQLAHLSTVEALFSESNGRHVVEVRPNDADEFRTLFDELPVTLIGHVSSDSRLVIVKGNVSLIDVSIEHLVAAWK